jgi:hypothetical protein
MYKINVTAEGNNGAPRAAYTTPEPPPPHHTALGTIETLDGAGVPKS